MQRLQALHPREIALGLERVRAVARRLNVDLSSSQVVVVGGTNGKGSTLAALQSIGLEHGLSVGSYTSPHLLRFNERIRVDGRVLEDETLCQLFEEVDEAREEIALTYFEFTTLAALRHFDRTAPDWCLLEVGLGGRLDAVNIIDADVTVVTNIQLDHVDWLGGDRGAIAVEKAGIFREGVPALCAEHTPPEQLRSAARDRGARWLQAGEQFDLRSDTSGAWRWWGVDCSGAPSEVAGTRPLSLAPEAVSAALQVAQLLLSKPRADVLAHAVERATLLGRCQALRVAGRVVVLDVAHNPAAAARLASYLGRHPVAGRTHVLLALMADKDAEGFVRELTAVVDGYWWLPALAVDRALQAGALRALLPNGAGEILSDAVDFLSVAMDQSDAGDRLVVTGSFHTVAAALQMLARRGIRFE